MSFFYVLERSKLGANARYQLLRHTAPADAGVSHAEIPAGTGFPGAVNTRVTLTAIKPEPAPSKT